jgi:hypothetical protein
MLPRRQISYGDKECRQLVWNVANLSPKDPKGLNIRIDPYGKEIHYDEFEEIKKYGWFITHIIPRNRGGSNYYINLQAVHYSNM